MDYNYYRYKAGLNWDKFIELHPEIEGEELFTDFMKRHECYTKQRDIVSDKFKQRLIDEKDLSKYPRIEMEKNYAIAQVEYVFIDVLRVAFGLAPDDKYAKFGTTIEDRYSNLVSGYMCDKDSEDAGLYIGADGLYRIASFYDDDPVDIHTMYRWWELKKQNKVYQTEEPPEDSYDVDLIIDGIKIKLPEKKTGDPKKYLDVISNYLLGFDYDLEDEEEEEEEKEKEKEEEDNQKKITDYFKN